MRHAAAFILCLALLLGCQASDIRGYWKSVPLLEKDISVSEDRFAGFAELAVEAPEADALAAMDVLFDRLKEDAVAYYIYADWVEGAFYSPLSPCRNVALYSKAVDRITADAVLQEDEREPFLRKRQWAQYNLPGTPACVPGYVSFTARTLVLVLDLSCPSCQKALDALSSDPQWVDVSRVAVCCGYGPHPAVPGWDYLFPEDASSVFDLHLTPVYFVVAADGTVEIGYTPALK